MGTDVVDIAREWIGTPYHHQQSLKGIGCDCLGLLRGVWRTYYQSDDPQTMPNYSPSWTDHRSDDPLVRAAEKFLLPATKGDLQGGEVVLFRLTSGVAAKHCAILTADNTMIHAYTRHGVVEAHYSEFWRKKAVKILRFKDR